MIDFAAARRMMVDGQVRTADVTDPRLLAAMLDLPRERFFPEDKASLAYLDLDVPVSETGQPVRRLLKPMVLAKLHPGGRASPKPTACSMSAAPPAIRPRCWPVLPVRWWASRRTRASPGRRPPRWPRPGTANAKIVTGALAAGCPAEGPYDLILLEGATEVVPDDAARPAQERRPARRACSGRGQPGKAMLYRRIDGDLSGRPVFDAAAPLLPGFAKPQEFVF